MKQTYIGLWLKLRRTVVSHVTDVLNVNPSVNKKYAELACRLGALEEGRGVDIRTDADDAATFELLTVTLPACGKSLDRLLSKHVGEIPLETYVACIEECGLTFNQVHHLTAGLILVFWIVDDAVRRDLSVNSRRRSKGLTRESWDLDTSVLRMLRQLLLAFYKLEIPYSAESREAVIQRFIENDRSLKQFNEKIVELNWISRTSRQRLERQAKQGLAGDNSELFPLALILSKARAIVTRCVGAVKPKDIVPKHGPGAVATGEKPWEKSQFKRIYASLESVYPFDEYFMYSLSHVADEIELFDRLLPIETGTSKVVLVPKDSRGPRLIACEPLEIQWIQQGLKSLVVSELERPGNWSEGHVNFTDQTINQRLAKEGSEDSSWATLDMKDASDLVGLELVRALFDGTRLLTGLEASRCVSTTLPDGTTMRLEKYASMGSALCFPIESLCFYALSVAAIHVKHGLPLKKAKRAVYVYGDDMIIAPEFTGAVCSALEAFGLRLNVDKCCSGDSFRESCGMDAYRGVQVSPLRIKRLVYHHGFKNNPETLVAAVGYSNQLWSRGYSDAALYVAEYLAAKSRFVNYIALRGTEKALTERSGTTLFFDASSAGVGKAPLRWNKQLQRHEYQSGCIHVPLKRSRESGWCQMLNRLTPSEHSAEPGNYPFVRGMRIKRTWLSAQLS